MQNVSKTQGADFTVKTIRKVAAMGTAVEILPAVDGVKYRVVGVQISVDATGNVQVYHGDAVDTDNVIASGFVYASSGMNAELGDWGPQVGQNNQAIKANVSAGNADIVLHYIELA